MKLTFVPKFKPVITILPPFVGARVQCCIIGLSYDIFVSPSRPDELRRRNVLFRPTPVPC